MSFLMKWHNLRIFKCNLTLKKIFNHNHSEFHATECITWNSEFFTQQSYKNKLLSLMEWIKTIR